MKHIFVESNWVFGYCAPAHQKIPDAVKLAERAGAGELKVYVPAVALKEGENTIRNKCQPTPLKHVREFQRWAVSEGLLEQADVDAAKPVLDVFQSRVQSDLASLTRRVDSIRGLAGFEAFALSDAMLERALEVRSFASLKPFDEAIFAAVLVRGAELAMGGEKVYFCDLDMDLAPFDKNGEVRTAFDQAYKAAGIEFRRDFSVP